jgi:sodium transport system ATP-binding protein
MISVDKISKSFWDRKRGAILAVQPTTFQIAKGEIFGLLGPNGAGKTTLLRMLATIITPDAGTATINNFDLRTQTTEIKKSIGFISGNTRLDGRLTPRELMAYFGALYEMPSTQIQHRAGEIFTLLEMDSFVDQRIEKLSTGQTQKASIARCLLHDPPVFIFDEPTLGLDILTSRTIIHFIRTAAQNGKTIILSTHYMEEAELLCQRIGLIHLGKILAIDTLAGFQQITGKQHLADIFIDFIQGVKEERVEA